MPRIVSVEPLSNHRLRLGFADGVTGDVDLSHLAGRGVFSAWDEIGVFESVAIGPCGELQWGEEIDLCRDALYLQVTGRTSLNETADARS